jgi:hypothetical protein
MMRETGWAKAAERPGRLCPPYGVGAGREFMP